MWFMISSLIQSICEESLEAEEFMTGQKTPIYQCRNGITYFEFYGLHCTTLIVQLIKIIIGCFKILNHIVHILLPFAVCILIIATICGTVDWIYDQMKKQKPEQKKQD